MMKHLRKLFLILGLFPAVLALPSQGGNSFSPHLDGTMMPYDGFSRQAVTVPWDSTFTPVSITYIARHGARFLSSEKKVGEIEGMLENAEKHRSLSGKGKDFLKLLDKVSSVTAGQWGALNALGMEEESRLGRECSDIAGELFDSGRAVSYSTGVPRVVMSMYEFCHSLCKERKSLNISTSEGPEYNPLLRFFDTDSVYLEYLEKGPWRKVYDEFAVAHIPVEPARRMMPGETDVEMLRQASMAAYGVLQSLRAAGIECNPGKWFTEEEYRACWEVDNLRHYLQRSANPVSPIPAVVARGLLDKIVCDITLGFTDCDESQHLKSTMYFGHAETLMPLFALMKLPGCYVPDCQPEQVASQWKDWEVSPLGANLVVVSLRGSGGDEYAALRLNGEWVGIMGDKVMKWDFLKKIWEWENPLSGGPGIAEP